ncbi:2-dehydropantoate 2-reductase N-terminal domain-containing protein, partial [Nocardia gipuzkoensis]
GRIAVIGSGAIGQLTALYARQQGWPVRVLDRQALATYELERQPISALSGSQTDEFDVVVDAASGESSQPLEAALALVADGGTVIVQNAYHPAVQLLTPLRDVFRRSVRIVGSFSYCRRGQRSDFELAQQLLHTQRAEIEGAVETYTGLGALLDALGAKPNRTSRKVLALTSTGSN